MIDFNIAEDEVILFEDSVYHEKYKIDMDMILTNKRILLKGTKVTWSGFLMRKKNEEHFEDEIKLEDIKIYKDKVQVTRKSCDVLIQTKRRNVEISFGDSIADSLKAKQFIIKVTDALTDTSMTDRGLEKTDKTINKVDKVLGFNTRETVKDVLENGVIRTIFRGRKKK